MLLEWRKEAEQESPPVLGSVAGEVRSQTGLVPAHVFELLVFFAEPTRVEVKN